MRSQLMVDEKEKHSNNLLKWQKKSRDERNINGKSEYKKLNMSRIKKKEVSKKDQNLKIFQI
jgi:hypothetical protein